MGETTNIGWTQSTHNPWWGCTKVSAGCDHCYAETLDARWGDPHWGKGIPRRVMSDSYWKQPLKWDKAAGAAGVKHKVFCASMADVMYDEAPEGQREPKRQIRQKPQTAAAKGAAVPASARPCSFTGSIRRGPCSCATISRSSASPRRPSARTAPG